MPAMGPIVPTLKSLIVSFASSPCFSSIATQAPRITDASQGWVL